jgi:hypothetical protein
MANDDDKFIIEGNPGTGNTFIKIGTAYNVNPNAKEVKNTFIIGNGKDATAAIKEAMGQDSHSASDMESPFNRMPESDENVDITPIRTEILNYVSRVRPLLTDEAKSTFMKMWEDILALPAVESKVYKPGKQWGTNFHRDLVANILYHLRSRKIYKVVYKDNYNGAAMCEALEGDRDHSVKHALRDEPPMDVRGAVDKLLKEKY